MDVGVIDIDFATLSGFDYVEGMELPSEVVALDQEVVTVSGFMRREEPGDVERREAGALRRAVALGEGLAAAAC